MMDRPKIRKYRGLLPTAKQLQVLREAGYTEMPRSRSEASRMIQQYFDDVRRDELEWWGYAIDPYDNCF